jgi:hypothetical protein
MRLFRRETDSMAWERYLAGLWRCTSLYYVFEGW